MFGGHSVLEQTTERAVLAVKKILHVYVWLKVFNVGCMLWEQQMYFYMTTKALISFLEGGGNCWGIQGKQNNDIQIKLLHYNPYILILINHIFWL